MRASGERLQDLLDRSDVNHSRGNYLASANVSHARGSPVSMPRLNHATRCAELPCVNDSGTTARAILLQPIVSDGCGGIQPFFDVARIELDIACGETPGLCRFVPPYAGIAISLQFDPHRAFVRVPLNGSLSSVPVRFCT